MPAAPASLSSAHIHACHVPRSPRPSRRRLRPVLDEASLQRLHELDPQGANRVVERVLRAFEASLTRLLPQSAQALGQGDHEALRHVVHTLKSSSASVGALELSRCCSEIENRLRQEQLDGLAERLAGAACRRRPRAGGRAQPAARVSRRDDARASPGRRAGGQAARGAAGRRRRGQPAADRGGAARARLRHHRVQRRRACAAAAGRLGAGHHRARRDDARAGRLRHLPPAARHARLRERAGADAHRPGRRCVDHPRLPGRRHRLLRQGQPVEPARRAAAATCCAPRARASSSSAARPSWRARRTWRAWAASTGAAPAGRQRRLADAVGRGPARARPRPGRAASACARSCAWCRATSAARCCGCCTRRWRAQLGAGHRRAGDAARRPPAHHPRRGRARVQRTRPRRRLHRHRAGRDRPPRRRGPDPPPGELRLADRPAEPAPADLARRARARACAAPGPPGARCC